MTPITQDHIQGVIFAYSQQKHTAEEIHSKLLNLTRKEMWTLEQVKNFHEKIKKGEFVMNCEKIPVDPKLQFSYIMKHCHKHVLKHCDISDRLTLRKVDHKCRNLIDNTKFQISMLKIHDVPTRAMIQVDSTIIIYEKYAKGLVLTNGDKTTLMKTEDGILTALIRDLETILANPKLEIGELKIVGRFYYYAALKQHFKVRQLTCTTSEVQEILFPLIDPEYIETIKFMKGPVGGMGQPPISESPMERMRQWKNAKILITDFSFTNSSFLKRFAHFDYMDYYIHGDNQLGVKDVVALKDALLKRPSLQKFELIPSESGSILYPFNCIPFEPFLPYQSKNDPELFEFKYPCDPSKVMTLRANKNQFVFKGPCYSGNKTSIRSRRDGPLEGDLVDDGENFRLYESWHDLQL